jgi:protein phosphatase
VEVFVLEHIQWFANLKGHRDSPGEDTVLADFQRALTQANYQLIAEAAERPALREMGTTLTLAYSLNDDLFVAHVGDSRCYLYRQDVVQRLTSDHTLVEEMVRRGVLRAEDAEHHDMRHVITNALGGTTNDVNVELHRVRLHHGDVVLLCSDGLTNMVSDDEISAVLRVEEEPEGACRKLVERANEAGGRDNITVIYARYEAVHEH